MTLATVVFDYPDIHFPYQQLHDVFRTSFIEHNPDIPFVTIRIEVPIDRSHDDAGCWSNTAKLRAWTKFIRETDDDVILADCDMFCIGSAARAFDIEFDIAYTKLTVPQRGRPLNGGIVMVRNTIAARRWITRLMWVNEAMYTDPAFHQRWRRKYAGMNQSAMGYMIETAPIGDCAVHAYSTSEWNAVDCDWRVIDESTVFVHMKSALRRAAVDGLWMKGCNGLLNKWRATRDRMEVMG